MKEVMVEITLPQPIVVEVKERVDGAEFRSFDDAVAAALRYYLDRHRRDAVKDYVSQEIAAGLNESA